MKGGVRKKSYFIIVLSNFITFPVLGWYLGGIYLAALGFFLALVIDKLFPTWKSELEWKDINIALNNVYLYGSNPCELCFFVNNKRVYVYRDEKGSEKEPIRMAIRIPLSEWSDIYSKEELRDLYQKYGGSAFYSNNRGPQSYLIFSRSGRRVDDCKAMLKSIFEKTVGGLKPDIYASSIVNSKENIWVKHPM